jgi:hypothetical protein
MFLTKQKEENEMPSSVAIFVKEEQLIDLKELNRRLEQGYEIESISEFAHGKVYILGL